MNKKALDEKYSYQIDEHNVVHLFRGEEDCQQHLTNPLISAIFKIETLEKENTELKERFKHRNCLDCSNHSSKLKMRTLELEKENAELKQSNKMLEQGYIWHDYDAGEDCYEDSHEGKWVKRDEVYQLTRAKEILSKLLEEEKNNMYWEMNGSDKSSYYEVRREAEQFISEVEE